MKLLDRLIGKKVIEIVPIDYDISISNTGITYFVGTLYACPDGWRISKVNRSRLNKDFDTLTVRIKRV